MGPAAGGSGGGRREHVAGPGGGRHLGVADIWPESIHWGGVAFGGGRVVTEFLRELGASSEPGERARKGTRGVLRLGADTSALL